MTADIQTGVYACVRRTIEMDFCTHCGAALGLGRSARTVGSP